MKFRRLISNRALVLLLLLAAVGFLGAGCSTMDEADNASAKPWASPEGFQSGAMGSYLNRPH
jgi:hypothetical protein